MKKVLLILGNITFDHFEPDELKHFKNPDGKKALIHGIDALIMCESQETAIEIGELHCNEYDSYVVPSKFLGEVAYEDSRLRVQVESFVHVHSLFNY